MEFLSPRPDEPVIVKATRNCFRSTDLPGMRTCYALRDRFARIVRTRDLVRELADIKPG